MRRLRPRAQPLLACLVFFCRGAEYVQRIRNVVAFGRIRTRVTVGIAALFPKVMKANAVLLMLLLPAKCLTPGAQ